MDPSPRLRRRLGAPLAALAVLALVATGCVPTGGDTAGPDDGGITTADGSDGGGEGTTPGTEPALAEIATSSAADLPDPAGDPAYAAYYEQRIDWVPCADGAGPSGLECGEVTVPRVWDDPAAGDIDIAVAQRPADGTSAGSLVVNPGGPGGSGIDFVGAAGFVFSGNVLENLDVVGFDPRGVGRSAGISCLGDEELDERRASSDLPLTDEGFADLTEWAERTAVGCEDDAADLLPHLDTLSAARDMDVLRAALDAEELDYVGYSYGTYLGATYAETYPDRVGSFVLDGALDPTLTADGIVAGQAAGFEAATGEFIDACLAEGDRCPLRGDREEAGQQLRDTLAALEDAPMPTSDPDRPLTASLARAGLLILMYEDGLWQIGRSALTDLVNGDGTALLALADQSAERSPDGTYSGNGSVAITAVNCLDHPGVEDLDWQREEAERLAAEYPTFGPSFGFTGYTCSFWPAPAVREPAPIAAEGAGPIVVIGTTGDPATPYEWSEALADQLDSAVLLTYEGDGHTAYGRSGGCIEDLVDTYLLEDVLPEDGTVC